MIDICAHISPTRFSIISAEEIEKCVSLETLFEIFKTRKLATDKALENGEIELRFQYKSRDVMVRVQFCEQSSYYSIRDYPLPIITAHRA